jgi:glycerophosphoryl diester phosphodiesterase
MLLIAHRGDHSTAPENSIEAFEAAIASGADGIELDVRSTADGVPVVMHDPTIERTTGIKLRVSKSKHTELSGARLANGEQIPTLAEVVERFHGRTVLYIELKDRASAPEAQRLALSKPRGRFVFSSFDKRILAAVAGARKALLWDKRGSPVAPAERLGCSQVHLRRGRLCAKVVKAARAHNLGVMAWDVKSAHDVKKSLSLGLDGVIVEDVIRAREFVGY